MLSRDDILNYALALPPGDRELVAVALQDSLETDRNPAGRVGDTDATDFLARADRLDRLGRTDSALDLIYSHIDEMLLAGNFTEVDNRLVSAKCNVYSVDVLLALLTITYAAKRRLPHRQEFYARVERSIRERDEWEEWLLYGLE